MARKKERRKKKKALREIGLTGGRTDFLKRLKRLKKLEIKSFLHHVVPLGMIVTHLMMVLNAWMCITGSTVPFVAVISGSMEPCIRKGDILFLLMSKDPIRAGDIVVYEVDGKSISIIHRVIKVHERRDNGEVYILTKGDNNIADDKNLYPNGQLWLQRHHITGRAVWFLPYGSLITIILLKHANDIVEYILIAFQVLLSITENE